MLYAGGGEEYVRFITREDFFVSTDTEQDVIVEICDLPVEMNSPTPLQSRVRDQFLNYKMFSTGEIHVQLKLSTQDLPYGFLVILDNQTHSLFYK